LTNIHHLEIMKELIEMPKPKLRKHNGRFASEVQHLRDENKRLRDRIELLERQQPTFQEIRKNTILKETVIKQQKIMNELHQFASRI